MKPKARHEMAHAIVDRGYSGEFRLTGVFTAGDPGFTAGPPENCYPPEPDEFDPTRIEWRSDCEQGWISVWPTYRDEPLPTEMWINEGCLIDIEKLVSDAADQIARKVQ